MAALIAVTAATAGIVTASYAGSARGRVDRIVHTDAPSVEATGDFLLKVADMDAQLANVLLIHDDTTLSIHRADSMRLYEADRSAADADLTTVTAVLAGDPAAQSTLRSVTELFGDYQEAAVRTLQLDELAHLPTAGNAPLNVLTAYRQALNVLEGPGGTGSTPKPATTDTGSLLAQARVLDRQSSQAVARSAADVQGTFGTATMLALLIGLVLLALLGILQKMLYRGFHRILNPALAAATVAALFLFVGGLAAFSSAGNRLNDTTTNAFVSIGALTDAKALAYDANADESRWLLDPTNAGHYEASFLAKSQDVAGIQGATTLAQYEPWLTQLWSQNSLILTPDSALGEEIRNITYDGEFAAASDAVNAWEAYQKGDAHLRTGFSLNTPTGLRSAIDFDTDVHDPTTSDALFNAFSGKVDQVVAVNQDGFDSSSATTLSGLGLAAWLPYLEALAVVVLVPIGLRARLAEFR